MVRKIIIDHFNLVLLLSILFGLVTPGLEYAPKSSAMILISMAIFFSCSRVSMQELRQIKISAALAFYVVRFVLFPIYWVAKALIPDYAMGIFLVALAPVGASATAAASICGANSSLALSSTIITNALAPLIMPLLIYYIGGSAVDINIQNLCITLGLAIFLPAFVYFAIVRRIEPLKLWVRTESQFFSTLCIAGMMAVVTAMEKDFIMKNLGQVTILCGIGLILFLVLYGVAWLYAWKMSFTDRKTYMVCSGVNNTGISTGIALLYFSPATILFSIVVEIPWTLGLIAFKRYADKYS
jgi:predicted Na+-dependent transporter